MKRIGTLLIMLVALLGLRPVAQAQSCVAPTNVRVSNTGTPGNTSAVVSFTPSATALSYTAVYFWSGDTTALMSVSATASPVTLMNLRTGSQDFYRVRVLSNCAGGSVAASPWGQFQVGGSGGPGSSSCGVVSNIMVTAASDSTATVSFVHGAGNMSFQLSFFVTADSIRTRRMVSATASPVTLRNLLPGRIYTVRVMSVCGAGSNVSYSSPAAVSFTQRSALATRTGLGMGQLSVSPNPASRTVRLVLPAVPGIAQAQLVLFNALGQAVRRQAVPLVAGDDTRVQFDLSNVVSGLYTLRVMAGSQVVSQRLVVDSVE